MGRIAFWIILVVLLAGNGMIWYASWLAHTESGDVWEGALLPGKVMRLPDRTPVADALPVVAKAEEEKKAPAKKAPEEQFVPDKLIPIPDAKPHIVAAVPPRKDRTPEVSPKPVVRKKSDVDYATLENGYVVRAGRFVLGMGPESLIKRLKKRGMKPRLVQVREMVMMHLVQAGPFPTLEAAKEAEIKLRANGKDVRVEETWEGFMLSISRYYLLSYAMEELREAERLEISPVRLMRVASDLPVKKVILGPYPEQKDAAAMSAAIYDMGLSYPVVEAWNRKTSPFDPTEEN
ncbi:SPOR domain-containing protein [Magnetococcales bacterium HHB-1]